MTFVFGCFKQVNLLICCVQGVSKKWTARLKKKLIPGFRRFIVGPAIPCKTGH